MGPQSDLVERVVRMQLTSPGFAEYCVAHVTDPKHRFLFAQDDDSAERRLYVRLLGQLGGQAAAAPAAASGASGTAGPGQASALWLSLLDCFSSTRGVRGPHMPHMFRTEGDLAAFLDMLDSANRDGAAIEGVVLFMLRRLPMTEAFLYVLWYLCDARVHEARKERRHRGEAHDANAVDAAAEDTTLQAAGTLLFIANMLLLKHEGLESPVRYISVFEAYMQRMVEALAGAAPRDSPVAAFVRETVAVWCDGGVFAEETLLRMKRALGPASG
ncbi:uncharacterized protein Tco025E_04279 [Trypanosoma conorhini]|uniref:Uncharacterized protein n=1 Tax=Trypanosoma conorhini TaxID=83891 RepID=A0A422PMY5_9TRYP|nr:uncharacterized protein Tco025E_04279 [Trypanosoma conorhini]RNF19089.1 hypothetical protein Tco025E_04279 [Trypanosoma conorhini]